MAFLLFPVRQYRGFTSVLPPMQSLSIAARILLTARPAQAFSKDMLADGCRNELYGIPPVLRHTR